jgi:DNA mismatch endonuclease (patch repair protein)
MKKDSGTTRKVGRWVLEVDPITSARMAGVRQKATVPELAVRRVAYAAGLRFRTRNKDLPGSPDIANRTARWAVFVHGCFWHRHAGCAKATTPKRNLEFWAAKFSANEGRDQRVQEALVGLGYDVLVVWECDVELRIAQVVEQFADLARRTFLRRDVRDCE